VHLAPSRGRRIHVKDDNMSSTHFFTRVLPHGPAAPEGAPVTGARARRAGALARRAWRFAYVRRLVAGDLACAVPAAAAGYLAAPGVPQAAAVAAALPVAWVLAMLLSRSYEQRFLWEGPEEFRRVLRGAALLLAAVATLDWGLQLEIPRGVVGVALPLSTALTLAQRQGQRWWLRRQRAKGRYLQTLLLVGPEMGVAAMHEQLRPDAHGYRVVGCCLPVTGVGSQRFHGLPVLGGFADVADVVRGHEVDTVAVLPSRELDGAALRRLGWQLEKSRADLLLAPAVTEVAGPRVRTRPVCGWSLLKMERPELRGVRRLVKACFDRVVAGLAILLLLPVLLVVAVVVKTSGPGPVLVGQQRVGRDGRMFQMLTFRSTEAGAEHLLEQPAPGNERHGVLFTRSRDPRVTGVGRLLRRYSLDELPQLFNVLTGDMSLVGPRPLPPDEVEQLDEDMHRRFVVKPGLTGLWQVSGRSNPSWDDVLRIEIQYVENWSLSLDLMIIGRTFGAVLRGDGAS